MCFGVKQSRGQRLLHTTHINFDYTNKTKLVWDCKVSLRDLAHLETSLGGPISFVMPLSSHVVNV